MMEAPMAAPRRFPGMEARAAFVVFAALLGALCGTPAGAQEQPRSLVVLVADFDSSGVSEADLKEYVDYLASAVERSLALQVQQSGPYTEARVIWASAAKESTALQPGMAEDSEVLLLLGTLRKTGKGYALVVRVADRETGAPTVVFERAYRDEQELYSGCAGLARDLALACAAGQPVGPAAGSGEAREAAQAGWSAPLWAAGVALGGIGYISSSWPPEWAESSFLLLRGYYGRGLGKGLPLGIGLDLSAYWTSSEEPGDLLLGADLYASLVGLVALGVNFSYYIASERADPCLGFSVGLLDIPPVCPLIGTLGGITVRWDLISGKRILTVRLLTLTAVGVSGWLLAGLSSGR
jgi:hypothetical protein